MRLQESSNWRTESVECFLLEPHLVTETYVDWLNDADVNQFLESRFAEQTLASVREFVAQQLDDASTLFLGIRSLDRGVHVGNIKLAAINLHHGLGEVGIMIGDRNAWGQGIGTAALRIVVNIARYDLGLRKLTAGCYASNAGSTAAFVKAGFEIEGVRPAHFMLNNKPEDFILMARHLARVPA